MEMFDEMKVLGATGTMLGQHITVQYLSFLFGLCGPAKPDDTRIDHSIKYNQFAGEGTKGVFRSPELLPKRSTVE
jgi:hypothetical protein